jgi:hypothetical protein
MERSPWSAAHGAQPNAGPAFPGYAPLHSGVRIQSSVLRNRVTAISIATSISPASVTVS